MGFGGGGINAVGSANAEKNVDGVVENLINVGAVVGELNV